jgi:hypothetical protein
MFTTPPRGRLVLPAVLLALAVPVVAAGPVTAMPAADHLHRARHRTLGSHVTNHHTHMETWIVGFYPYRRRVKIHGHLHAKRFYGLRVSAQRCDRRHCWGRTVGGKLWSPHQPGRPLRGHTRAEPRRTGGPRSDFCLPGSTTCAAPWNWFARYIDRRQRELVRRFIDPCAAGSLAGGGVVAVKDLSARILFEGGVLTAARAASAFEGPPGIALGALSGCMAGVGARGVHTVSALVHKLNPFDRTATGRHG